MVMVKELFALARVSQQERHLPGFRAQQWYFAFVAAFWLYIRFINNNLVVEITSSARLARAFGWVLARHTALCYALYTAGGFWRGGGGGGVCGGGGGGGWCGVGLSRAPSEIPLNGGGATVAAGLGVLAH